jgi:hypothetical protein
MRFVLTVALFISAWLISLASSPAYAACGTGRLELVGHIPDVFFRPGVPSTRTITYHYKSIDDSLYHCDMYARSVTKGVSVRASYGSNTVHPPSAGPAKVGPAIASGMEMTWSFELIYDGVSAPPNTHGFVKLLSNIACEVCTESYREIGSINVYLYATMPSTFFTVKASASSIDGEALVLDHPLTNGKSDQRLFVTPKWNFGGVYDNHPVSVRYDGTRKRWLIQHDDGAPMAAGTAFNVRIEPRAAQVTAQSGQNSLMLLQDDNADGNPNAIIFVTPVDKGVRNPHPIAVRYVDNTWTVWNADEAPMPQGAVFNVKVMGYGQYLSGSTVSESTVHTGIAVDVEGVARTSMHFRTFDFPWLNGRPNAPVILTANYNPRNRDAGVANPHQVGVWYTPSGFHSVFNQDFALMPADGSYNLWAPQRCHRITLPRGSTRVLIVCY